MKVSKILLLLIVGLSLCYCSRGFKEENHNYQQKGQRTEETSNQNADSVSANKEKQNSETETDTYKEEIKGRESSTEKSAVGKSSDNSIISWLGLACGVACWAVVIVVFRKAKYHDERLNRHRREIEELKNESTSSSNGQVNDLQDLFRRLEKLEKQMQEAKTQTNTVPFEIKHSNNEKPVLTKGERGYFETPIEGERNIGYFIDMLPKKGHKASFSAEVEGSKAKFEPIAQIGTIVSSDSMRLAIEFSGANKNEATTMNIIDKGIAEQKNGRWIITKKASVKLIK